MICSCFGETSSTLQLLGRLILTRWRVTEYASRYITTYKHLIIYLVYWLILFGFSSLGTFAPFGFEICSPHDFQLGEMLAFLAVTFIIMNDLIKVCSSAKLLVIKLTREHYVDPLGWQQWAACCLERWKNWVSLDWCHHGPGRYPLVMKEVLMLFHTADPTHSEALKIMFLVMWICKFLNLLNLITCPAAS